MAFAWSWDCRAIARNPQAKQTSCQFSGFRGHFNLVDLYLDTKRDTLVPNIAKQVKHGSTVYTDEAVQAHRRRNSTIQAALMRQSS
jgi:hypothetical protein